MTRLVIGLLTAFGAGLFSAGAQQGLRVPGSPAPLKIDLQEAIRRAREYSPDFQTAVINAGIARQKLLQAKAARLPTLDAFNQFIYTQGNGTPSGVYVANDGVHVYTEQAIAKGDLFSIFRGAPVNQAKAAEAVSLAERDVAARGLVATVTQNYYKLLSAEHKITNVIESLRQAQDFLDIAEKQEQAGFVSHVDVTSAQLQKEQRLRDLQSVRLAADQARLALAVLLFPNFDENFTVVDDLSSIQALPPWDQVRALGLQDNPEIRSARASRNEARYGVAVARYGYLPSLDAVFYYGINANQFATETSSPTAGVERTNLPDFIVPERQNLGFSYQVTLNVPVWNWGSTRSKVREAQLGSRLAEIKLQAAQRQLESNLRSYYAQAETDWEQLSSLLRSRNLAAEYLRLTLLRYTAGESTALEVATAAQTAAEARNAYDDGLAAYHQSLANLQTLTGRF